MAIKDWSTTAGSNNTASPDGAPEGWKPSEVNATVRENMAQVRGFRDSMEWRDWGHTSTFASATTFTTGASLDTTAIYVASRRVRAVGSSTGTIYGTVTASSGTNPTTVTVDWDTASELISEALVVSCGLSLVGGPVYPVGGAGTSLRGGASVPSWQAGAWEYVTAKTLITDATVLVYHDGFDSGADFIPGWDYFVRYDGIYASSDLGYVMQAQTFEGAAYVTATNKYINNVLVGEQATGAVPVFSTDSPASPSSAVVGWRMGDNAQPFYSLSGWCEIQNAADPLYLTSFDWKTTGSDLATGQNNLAHGISRRQDATTAAKHVKMFPSGSDFAAGRMRLFRRLFE